VQDRPKSFKSLKGNIIEAHNDTAVSNDKVLKAGTVRTNIKVPDSLLRYPNYRQSISLLNERFMLPRNPLRPLPKKRRWAYGELGIFSRVKAEFEF